MSAQPEALRLAEFCEGNVLYQPAAAELRRLHQHELAHDDWHKKTAWVQETARPHELGMHRADVMRQRLEQAEAQRDALLEALQALYDEQQGPPLIRHQAAWEAAMEKARAAIKKAREA